MSTSDWLRNARGEWFVIAQAVLMLAVLVAPKLDGRNVFWSGIGDAVGGLLCIIGLGFVVLGSIALGRNLSPFPKPKEKGTLVESEIFSVVRHPIYSGFSVAAFGWSLLWNSIAALVAALLLLAFFDIKARREERGSKKSSLPTLHTNRVSRNSFHSFIGAKLAIERGRAGVYTLIRLPWGRNVIEPGKLFFRCGSTVAAAHIL